MKIVFAGTPEFAVPSLVALYEAGYEIVAVLTQTDKPQGRKGLLTPSPVKKKALELGIPVLQPVRLREDYEALKETGAQLMVTCAYGQILTQPVLDLFPLGVWNVHASMLPAYRGAAPIQRCLIDGETQTGVTVMKTELGLDTGDMLLQRALPIADMDTAGSLSEKLSRLGAELIAEGLKRIESGDFSLTKQGEGSVCKKVQREAVDFSKSGKEVACLVRGLSPTPLAWGRVGGITLNFYFAQEVEYAGDEAWGTVLSASGKKGLIVKCGENAVRLTEVQPAGGKRMKDSDFLNGRKIQEGMRFENEPLL